MRHYIAFFRLARKRGAIGVFYPVSVAIVANSHEEAQSIALDLYEPGATLPRIIEDTVCPDGPDCPEENCKRERLRRGLIIREDR